MRLFALAVIAATALAAPAVECLPATTTSSVVQPSGSPPTPGHRRVRIHPRGHPDKCLAIEDAAWPWKWGQWALIRDCKMSLGYVWTVGDLSNTLVRVDGVDHCLAAGIQLHGPWVGRNGQEARLAYCNNISNVGGVLAWTYADGVFRYNRRREDPPQTFCLDDENGNVTEGAKAQIWECAAGNRNQLWDIEYL